MPKKNPTTAKPRSKKIVPSATFAQDDAAASIDRDGLLNQALSFKIGSATGWAELAMKTGGATDHEILDRLGDEWEGEPSESSKCGQWCAKGGAKPRIWLGMLEPTGPATLQGKDLVTACRRLLNIPDALTATARGRKGRADRPDLIIIDDPVKEQTLGKMTTIEERAVPIEEIFPSPENPRESFDEGELRQLGESLRDDGQLVPVIIRESGELVDGETRWRAAKLVGLTTLEAKIVRCTDAEAALVRLVSYRKRKDLNAIEEANGLKLLVEKYGCSQRELEARVGISQGQISNRLRLLELPKEWIEKIRTGEISATDGRTLATYSDCPRFFEALPTAVAWHARFIPDRPSSDHLVSGAVDALARSTRPVTKGADGPKFKLTDELREKLDVREVKIGHMNEPRAFNVDFWDALQSEAKKAAEDRAAARASKPKPAPSAAIPTNRLRELWAGWFARAIAARFAGKLKRNDRDTLERLALLYWVNGNESVGQAFRPGRNEHTEPTFLSLMKRSRDDLVATMCETFLEDLRDGHSWNLGMLDEIVPIAGELGITLDEFVPDVDMLEHIPDASRLSLFDYWDGLAPAKTTKKQAEQLVENWDAGWIPEIFKTIELDGVSF